MYVFHGSQESPDDDSWEKLGKALVDPKRAWQVPGVVDISKGKPDPALVRGLVSKGAADWLIVEDDDGVQVHRLGARIPFDLPVNPSAVPRVRALVRDLAPDVVHVHAGVLSPFAFDGARTALAIAYALLLPLLHLGVQRVAGAGVLPVVEMPEREVEAFDAPVVETDTAPDVDLDAVGGGGQCGRIAGAPGDIDRTHPDASSRERRRQDAAAATQVDRRGRRRQPVEAVRQQRRPTVEAVGVEGGTVRHDVQVERVEARRPGPGRHRRDRP